MLTAAGAARTPQRRSRPGPSQGLWLPAAVLAVLGVAIPTLASVALGSFGLPSVDDWSYRRIAVEFARTGHLHYGGWASMTLVGQLLLAWPLLHLLGYGAWVLSVFGMAAGVVAIGCAHWLARRVLRPAPAAGAVALLILAPGFALDTSTFMTDVPALAALLASLALGIRGLALSGRGRVMLIGLSLVVGVLGFSIREFDIAAPVVVGVCAVSTSRRRERAAWIVAGMALLVICAGVYEWTLSLPGIWKISLGRPDVQSLERLVRCYFLVALLASPAVVIAGRRRLVATSRPALAAGGGALVLAAGVLADRSGGLWPGNDVQPRGVAGTLLLDGARPVLGAPWLWHLATLVALAAGAALAALLITVPYGRIGSWRRLDLRDPATVFRLFGAAVIAGSALYVVLAPKVFDRYLWAPELVAAVLLLDVGRGRWHWRHWRVHKPTRWPATGVIAAGLGLLLVVLTLATTVDSDAYDAARWRAGQALVGAGVPVGEVDAGFEWVGAHAPGPVDLALQYAIGAPSYEPWYAQMEPGYLECAVVSGSPLSGPTLRPEGVRTYRPLGIGPTARLWLYTVTSNKCSGKPGP